MYNKYPHSLSPPSKRRGVHIQKRFPRFKLVALAGVNYFACPERSLNADIPALLPGMRQPQLVIEPATSHLSKRMNSRTHSLPPHGAFPLRPFPYRTPPTLTKNSARKISPSLDISTLIHIYRHAPLPFHSSSRTCHSPAHAIMSAGVMAGRRTGPGSCVRSLPGLSVRSGLSNLRSVYHTNPDLRFQPSHPSLSKISVAFKISSGLNAKKSNSAV